MSRRAYLLPMLCLAVASACSRVSAETVVLTGTMQTTGVLRGHITIKVPQKLTTVILRVPDPIEAVAQDQSIEAHGFDVTSTPKATVRRQVTDDAGNRYLELEYTQPRPGTITAEARYAQVTLSANLETPLPSVTLPLSALPKNVAAYLQPSYYVQSDAKLIKSAAASLTVDKHSESAVANALTIFIKQNLENSGLGSVAGNSDALSMLKSRSGPPTGWTNLFMALARASGIPARIVSGIVLSGKMSFPIDADSSYEETYTGGPTYWAQLWYPGAGWIDYDPGSSAGFIDSHHLPQGYARDRSDFSSPVSWSGLNVGSDDIWTESFDTSSLTDQFLLKCISTSDDTSDTLVFSRQSSVPQAGMQTAAQELRGAHP